MTTTTMRLQPEPVTLRTAVRFAGNLLYAVVAVVLLGRSDSGDTNTRPRSARTGTQPSD